MRTQATKKALVSLVIGSLLVLGSLPATAQDLPPEIPDPEGDTIDFAGNPTDGPDFVGVIAVEVTDFEGKEAWKLFDAIFDFVAPPDAITIIPEEPGPLLGGEGPLVLVEAFLSLPVPDAVDCQIVVVFTTEGLEQYSGAVGDPNNGNDTSLDLFSEGGEWMSGRTEYRDGGFSFVVDYNEIAAYIDGRQIQIVFPREAIPDGATWQIWVICGNDAISAGRDFVDLGSFVPGVIPTVSISAPTTTTTVAESESTQTTVTGTTVTTVPSTTPATATAEEPADGGGSTALLIVALSVVAGAGLIWFLFFRKREGPCDCEMEKSAYDTAAANYAAAQSELDAARQRADDWRGRESEARTEIVGLDGLRPRRGEFSDQSAFEAADADYRSRRAELESWADECGEEYQASTERVGYWEGQAAELWGEAQTWLGLVRACWERCFESPFDPGPTPPPPAGVSGVGDGGGGEGSDDDHPHDTPPPGSEPECKDSETREVVERTETFAVPFDALVRVSLSTDRGPLDDVHEMVSGNPVADTIAEFLRPDGSLELAPESLSGANARRWQDAIDDMRTLTFSVLKREIYVNIAFDVEDVTVECVRFEECRQSKWVTTGRQTVEKSRQLRTVTHTWSESDSGGRPLGATMTVVSRQIETAREDAKALSQFRADCK